MAYTIKACCTGCTACVKVCPVNAITGVRKELHIIDPEVCVDCGVCGRICPFKAVEDSSEMICEMIKRSLWLQPIIHQPKCVSCGVCLQACPTGVLEFADRADHHFHLIPYLADEKNCIGCSFCETACPTEAITMVLTGK